MDKDYIHKVVLDVHKNYPQSLHFFICCLSAFVGETVTYPLDILKTRLQVAGQLSETKRRPKISRLILSILKNEGVSSFWQGLSPALYRHFLYTGARMPIYEIMRSHVFELPPASRRAPQIAKVCELTCENNIVDSISKSQSANSKVVQTEPGLSTGYVWRSAVGGITSGAIAQFICSPTDLLKVRLQTERQKKITSILLVKNPSSPLGTSKHVPRYPPKIPITMRQLVREGGFFGLWRGGLPNVQRAALVNMGEMTTYDTAKRWFQANMDLTDGPLLHGCASTISGFVSAVLGTPADLIKTRMMNQRLLTETGAVRSPLYSGMIDCAAQVVRQEGFFTLYRGFFLIWARMAPWSLTFWLTYEKLREFTGAGGF